MLFYLKWANHSVDVDLSLSWTLCTNERHYSLWRLLFVLYCTYTVDMQDGDGVMTRWKQQKWWTMILLEQHVDTDELLSNWHHRSSVLSRVNMHWHVERDVVMYQGPFLSIHLSVCLSVCPIMVLNRNNCTYRATFPLHGTNVSLVFESNWPAKTPRISSQLGS